jgi:carbamoyltransferase
MSLILGLNAYHGDSAACLIRDGQLVAAAEEERFRRIKHWAG